jgi:hypothetical protein
MEGKERSAKYKEYMLPENVGKRQQELSKALSEVFGWKEINE